MRPCGLCCALAALIAPLMWGEPAGAYFCSVFDPGPCAPVFCGVYGHWPCVPEIDYPIGEDLRLTIDTKTQPPPKPDKDLDNIASLFKALRACWMPPDGDQARPGTEVTIRLSFKRSGELVGTPRWTYTTPNTPDDVRQRYRDAVTAALARCAPMKFTKGMGGAIAGRPIAIRYVEDRDLSKKNEPHP